MFNMLVRTHNLYGETKEVEIPDRETYDVEWYDLYVHMKTSKTFTSEELEKLIDETLKLGGFVFARNNELRIYDDQPFTRQYTVRFN